MRRHLPAKDDAAVAVQDAVPVVASDLRVVDLRVVAAVMAVHQEAVAGLAAVVDSAAEAVGAVLNSRPA